MPKQDPAVLARILQWLGIMRRLLLPILARSVALTVIVAAGAGTLGAQQLRLTVTPARPAPGAIVRVALTVATSSDSAAGADSIVSVTGTMSGEPLHFERAKAGSLVAIGAVPVDSTAATSADAIVTRASGRADTVRTIVELPPFPPPSEQLAVAPRFGEPLDSALEARVAREAAIARDIGRRSHERPRMWTATFSRPRPSAITSRFGAGRTFNGRVSSRHLGVDFRGATGTPVRAANRGIVVAIDTFYLGGRIVYVDHGAGVVTAYMHLSRALVAVGDTVQRGQRIALVGATGRVTGPHLHWAARYGTLTANPLDLLALPAVVSRPSERVTTPAAQRKR